MHKNLRSFLETLKKETDLVEIDAEVDSYLEIAEIHRRVIEEQGKALLFNRVKGSTYRVVTNLFGTAKRIDLAFGKKPQELVKKAVEAVEVLLPPKPKELWQFRDLAYSALKLGTKKVRRAPVLEVCDKPANLEELPLLQLWHEDGGHFITLPLVTPKARRAENTISECIAFSVTTKLPPEYIGKFTKAAVFIIMKPNSAAKHCPSRFFSAVRLR